MKNHVTFETALALKQAGFPQPAPGVGQVWYGQTPNGAIVITYSDGFQIGFAGLFKKRETTTVVFSAEAKGAFAESIFAPTAEDIIEQLPEGWRIEGWNGKFSIRVDYDGEYPRRFLSDTLVQAAADAWIEKKLRATWAELDAAIPKTGRQREVLIKARKLLGAASDFAESVRAGNFYNALKIIERMQSKEFPSGGVVSNSKMD